MLREKITGAIEKIKNAYHGNAYSKVVRKNNASRDNETFTARNRRLNKELKDDLGVVSSGIKCELEYGKLYMARRREIKKIPDAIHRRQLLKELRAEDFRSACEMLNPKGLKVMVTNPKKFLYLRQTNPPKWCNGSWPIR